MSEQIEQVVTDEQAAILLYAALATDPDLAADLHNEIENLIDISINQEDMTLAAGIKLRISKILLVLIQSEHTRTRANILRKFINLDTRVTLFIVRALREQIARIAFSEEDNLLFETENSN